MTTKHTKKKKMSTLYKLTNGDGQTRGGTQWGPGMSHSGTGEGGLCGPGWIHAYEHPLIAVLLNPIHADLKNPRLWEAEGEIAIRDGQLKCGCTTLTTIREIPLPKITTEMRVRFGILSSKEVCAHRGYNAWADKWLSGEDRSAAAAAKAAAAAAKAAYDTTGAAQAAYDAAAWAAEAAEAAAASVYAAYRASWAAAWAVQWAAQAAASAAYRATRAAACCGIDLAAIAENACHSGLT